MAGDESRWVFLSNHGYVLVAVARDPNARVREIAAEVGITERATQSILRDLEQAGYVTVTRVGRRNAYRLNSDKPMRHPLVEDYAVADLLAVLAEAT